MTNVKMMLVQMAMMKITETTTLDTFSTERGWPAATRLARALQASIEFTGWSGCTDWSIKSTTCVNK